MKIGVVKETVPGEARVAFMPETVKRLTAKKFSFLVERGAGDGASSGDDEYKDAGAEIAPNARAVWAAADAVVKIHAPTPTEVALVREAQLVVSLLFPLVNTELVRSLAARKASVISTDSIPRTTLAQMMDVLSSQATVAGYRAVILAAEALPKIFPMLMTAAGTIPAAKVLVIGAGVAGLQAIATSRRLGAVVEAFDVRKVTKEQVESLGAKFVEVKSEEDAQTASGYAKELSEAYKRQQAELIEQHLIRSDACITTALIPGRPAPKIITASMVEKMRKGTVIVDIAADQGGNCEVTRPGERFVTANGVTVVGERNLPSQMAVHASYMYSRNMEKLVLHIAKDGELKLDASDEITRGMLVVKSGDVVHGPVADALAKGVA